MITCTDFTTDFI